MISSQKPTPKESGQKNPNARQHCNTCYKGRVIAPKCFAWLSAYYHFDSAANKLAV